MAEPAPFEHSSELVATQSRQGQLQKTHSYLPKEKEYATFRNMTNKRHKEKENPRHTYKSLVMDVFIDHISESCTVLEQLHRMMHIIQSSLHTHSDLCMMRSLRALGSKRYPLETQAEKDLLTLVCNTKLKKLRKSTYEGELFL